MNRLRIAINQLNQSPGDWKGNTERIKSGILMGEDVSADIVVFPALSITGPSYGQLDKRNAFIETNLAKTEQIIRWTKGKSPVVIFGFLNAEGQKATAVAFNGKTVKIFSSGEEMPFFHVNNTVCSICTGDTLRLTEKNRSRIREKRVDVVFHPVASTFTAGLIEKTEQIAQVIAAGSKSAYVAANQSGTVDSNCFYGSSFAVSEKGEIITRANSFQEDFCVFDFKPGKKHIQTPGALQSASSEDPQPVIILDRSERKKPDIAVKKARLPLDEEQLYKALTQSIRDYTEKNGFSKVVIGLSGGIDSSLVAALSVKALGSNRVTGIMMPSRFSSKGSLTDSEKLAENLGIKTYTVPIKRVYETMMEELGPVFGKRQFNTTDENVQARVRGNYLMALSNEFSWLVLNTGNKSEAAMGYSTLYGDTIGGYAPLSDLFKTDCYRLAKYINSLDENPVIPEDVITKAPSAELAPDQKDQDSLPPYEQIDNILRLMLEDGLNCKEISERGFEFKTVQKVFRLLRTSEYKRRQEPLGPILSYSSLSDDLGLPVTNNFREEEL